ncbi:hypothetical protein Salat_1937700 [Sesamum alatum]|uniref:Cotton fiber protein n=1 Tax=Sesamum alatum TaxID=300844 RepID=A0AAE1Y4G4_9LAMI|nr:hypothetical protein Salat_1937700 [Sesamum alatum]
MPKKKPALLHKLTGLLKISLFLAKLKKPTIPNLVFLKKTRKLRNFKLLKPYNYYSYVKEYEFSPSSTPLIQFERKPQNGRISFRKLCSDVVFISRCLGKKEVYCLEMGLEESLDCVQPELGVDLSSYWSEDESVDERAERFIQRFYEEMRRQRLESNFN